MILNENQLIPYEISKLPKGPYLVFAPHPDDETLGMGGTIALAVGNGIDVNVVFATRGDMGGDPEIRTKEADAAARCLGIKQIFHLDMGDRKVFEEIFPENTVSDILNYVNPACLFLPSFQEIHPDHRALTYKVLSFLGKEYCSAELWFYEINRQGEINRLINIDPVLEKKKEAASCYKSQMEQLDYKAQALSLNKARSVTLGQDVNFAEGFWHNDSGSGKKPEENYFEQLGRYANPYSFYLPGMNRVFSVHEKTACELRSFKDGPKYGYCVSAPFPDLFRKISAGSKKLLNLTCLRTIRYLKNFLKF